MEVSDFDINQAREYYGRMDFQWIKGDDQSLFEKYKDVTQNEEDVYIEFQSGKRINTNLLNEYMIFLPTEDIHAQLPEYVASPHTGNTAVVKSITYRTETASSPNIEDTESAIYTLLKKQKKNSVDVSINIELNLPTRDLYNILTASFDNVDEEIINFVLSGIDIETIKAALGKSIINKYKLDAKDSKNNVASVTKAETNIAPVKPTKKNK